MVSVLKYISFYGSINIDIIDNTKSMSAFENCNNIVNKSAHFKWSAYSHSLTPPAWGHTGILKFLDISKTLRISVTSASLHKLIWHTLTAPTWRSCLKIIWLCAYSPVATPVPWGARAFGITTCPRILPGVVGSSMNLKTTCKDGEYSCKIGLTKVNVFQSFDMFNGIFDAPNLIGINYQYHQSCILLVKLSAFYISRFGVCR